MEKELLLKSIEKIINEILDKKLQPVNQRLDRMEKRLDNIESTQKTILKFIDNADKTISRFDETFRIVDKIKEAI